MRNRQMLSAGDSHVKVLVVDDHPSTADMLARAISRLGPHVEVVSATSGYEALKHAENGAVDILITDMIMPELTGLTLIEMLNDRPAISPAVSFLLTAHDSAEVREISQRLNVKQVISKPVNPELICQLISKTMDELKQSKPVNSEPTLQKPALIDLSTESKQEELNIAQLIREVAKKFQAQADIKDQLLVVGKTEPDSKVRGNAVQLRQVLENLVWNAIQNTPKGGTVIISSENESNMVKILVQDTGYGIPSAGEPDILDGSDPNQCNCHTGIKGNDQDLAIVKSIVEGHGGQISVESEPGKGSCFTFSLPLMQLITGQSARLQV